MGMKMVSNVRTMELRIQQTGERAMRGMADRMRRVAIRIRDLARDYAPVKTGLLEESIDYSVVPDGRRRSFVVFIDLDATKSRGRDGTDTVELGDYAFVQHEQLRPYGRKGPALRLGPGSAQKAAGGRRVGGKFLSRAITEGTKNILGELAAEVKRATSRGASSVGTQYERDYGDQE